VLEGDAAGADVLLALHARRSAGSVRAWNEARGSRGLCVVLTGTDLYGDLAHDEDSLASIEAASRLVVLQEQGLAALPHRHRARTRVIYQSTTGLEPVHKGNAELLAVMAGHLRAVKSPDTFFETARFLRDSAGIRLVHIGAAEEPRWADLARGTEAECPGYRWLGALPHEETRRWIRDAHVLVHPSAAEGGAHVVMEAVCSGTPVLASRVGGNVGMLGADYEGYFEPGDSAALAALLSRLRAEQGNDDPASTLLARLRAQCAARAILFAPETERAALLALVAELLEPR
jgi:putative glycosyltransferase (TIGR04348 family)